MKTMKYPNLSSSNMAVSGSNAVEEVDSIFTSSCWQNSTSEFIDHTLLLDGTISNLGSDKLLLSDAIQDETEIESKAHMEALDNLLGSSPQMNLAELKPLPPFTHYTSNLSINGIQGHHYHGLSQRGREENNNYTSFSEQNIVSSSTCNVGSDSGDEKTLYTVENVKLGYPDCVSADSVSSAMKFEGTCITIDSTPIKTEIDYDLQSIDDIAVIIGSAIADTTVPNNNPESDDPNGSRGSWNIDDWIGETCDAQKGTIFSQDGISDFLVPNTSSEFNKHSSQYSNNNNNTSKNNNNLQSHQTGSTLHNLLSHGHSLLQSRLSIKQETPSSSNYNTDLISTSSPPSNVVSTTDNLLLTVSGRFIPQFMPSIHDDPRIRSPELMGQNYPHTTTTTPNSKKSRNRPPKKQQPSSSSVFSSEQSLGLLGKEKPVHRCSICNRGFLNKSNIKVHLRTHTGEKPFRCDTCAKAFRQKAHLLKHQQIHKRIGRD